MLKVSKSMLYNAQNVKALILTPTHPLLTLTQSPISFSLGSHMLTPSHLLGHPEGQICNIAIISGQMLSSSGFLLPSQLRNSTTVSHTIPLQTGSSFMPHNPIGTPPPLRTQNPIVTQVSAGE
jgi:hypothetical protein